MLEARWGSRRWGCPFWQGTNCSTRGTLSTSSSSPTTPHVTSLPGKTFRPGWQNISRKTFFWQWHALSGPNVSLPSGKEIYPERKISKPDVASFSGGKVENNLCSFSLPSLDPSELIMAVGNKTASLNSLYLQPRLSLFNLQKQSWLQVQRIQWIQWTLKREIFEENFETQTNKPRRGSFVEPCQGPWRGEAASSLPVLLSSNSIMKYSQICSRYSNIHLIANQIFTWRREGEKKTHSRHLHHGSETELLFPDTRESQSTQAENKKTSKTRT